MIFLGAFYLHRSSIFFMIRQQCNIELITFEIWYIDHQLISTQNNDDLNSCDLTTILPNTLKIVHSCKSSLYLVWHMMVWTQNLLPFCIKNRPIGAKFRRNWSKTWISDDHICGMHKLLPSEKNFAQNNTLRYSI